MNELPFERPTHRLPRAPRPAMSSRPSGGGEVSTVTVKVPEGDQLWSSSRSWT